MITHEVNYGAPAMRIKRFWLFAPLITATFAGAPELNAGSLTYSHNASALPGASGPAITLLSITGVNDGTNFTFTLTFANPTIEGPSAGKADSIYGFINLDTDHNSATGVTGLSMNTNGLESGFGQYSPSSQGIDAYINLSSEGDPLHGVPGLVDLVTTNGFTPIATIAVTYSNQAGLTPSTMSLSIPLSVFSGSQITLLDTGDFSVVVGNLNNATDFLAAASVPEPSAWVLLAMGLPIAGLVSHRLSGHRASKRRSDHQKTAQHC
jgi:hypothetical protein